MVCVNDFTSSLRLALFWRILMEIVQTMSAEGISISASNTPSTLRRSIIRLQSDVLSAALPQQHSQAAIRRSFHQQLCHKLNPARAPLQHCAGDQSAVHVQSADGSAISAINSPEALDAALAGCNRKGNRERALQNALKRDQSKLRGWLQAGQTRGVSSHSQLPPSLAGEVNSADRQTIQVTYLGNQQLSSWLLAASYY